MTGRTIRPKKSAARTPPFEVGAKGTAPAVFTCGYSGHTPESYASLVAAAGARRVVDVRSFAFSRKPGFSKRALQAFLESRGLDYIHLPELGAPRELLALKKGGATMREIAPRYRRHLAGRREALEALSRLAMESPSVLLCLEKDPKECHRGILAERLARSGFRVVHL